MQQSHQQLLIIFDDVADSFYYKNKYAIIEYIKDLLDRPNVNAVILTHNFDFYRTLSKRLDGEFKHEVRQFEKSYDNQQAEQISLMV